MNVVKTKSRRLRLSILAVVGLFVVSGVAGIFGTNTATAFSGSGAGTVGNPFQITTCTQLQEMNDATSAHYRLMNNINCSATSTWNSGAGFVPIGPGIGTFSGSLDGQGFTISNLFINRPGESHVGLFSNLSGTVKNVGLTDVGITGSGSGYHGGGVGPIAGSNHASSGLIQNVYVTGTVTDTNFGDAGGLVGVNFSTIQNSYARVTVSGGGLGTSVGTGGLVGYNSGTITNSYSTGSVSSPALVGGLVGDNTGTVTNSFWDTQTSGQATSDGGTGKTTAELKTLATFQTVSWNIGINTKSNPNNGYPFLAWQAGKSSPVWQFFADDDGADAATEDAAPNSGDANNDTTPDSEQSHVTSYVSPISSKYVTLTTNTACDNSAVSSVTESSLTAADSAYNYPQGLMNFTADCGTPGFTTTVTQYYYGVSKESLILRKYNPNTNAYFTVAGATLEQVTVGGQSAVKITYSVTDGGDLDIDGTANGTIVDPVGLAEQVVGVPNTGLGRVNK